MSAAILLVLMKHHRDTTTLPSARLVSTILFFFHKIPLSRTSGQFFYGRQRVQSLSKSYTRQALSFLRYNPGASHRLPRPSWSLLIQRLLSLMSYQAVGIDCSCETTQQPRVSPSHNATICLSLGRGSIRHRLKHGHTQNTRCTLRSSNAYTTVIS